MKRTGLIFLEGPDGVGKTTLHRHLISELAGRGRSVLGLSFPGRSPGSLGELVYRLHHGTTDPPINDLAPAALQVAHVAAHIDAINRVIRPALEDGRLVVLDRFWWSTVAYGGIAGVPDDLLEAMVALEHSAWSDVEPALGILITAQKPHRIENDADTHSQLTDAYNELRRKADHPVAVVANDGDEATAGIQVLEYALSSLGIR